MEDIARMVEPFTYILAFNLLTAWPFWRIYQRAGLPGWWSLSAFLPGIGLVAVLAILGHARWPRLPARRAPAPPKTRRSFPTSPEGSSHG